MIRVRRVARWLCRRRCWVWYALVALLAGGSRLAAHEPYDLSTRVFVGAEAMELVATLGADAARQLFTAAGLTPDEVNRSLRALGPDHAVEQPLAVATKLFQASSEGKALAPSRVVTRSEGMEIVLTAYFPRPPPGRLEWLAAGYAVIPELRRASMLVADANATLGGGLLSAAKPRLSVVVPPR